MNEENKNFVSKYDDPLLKYLDEMDTTKFFVLVFVGILVIIGCLAYLSTNASYEKSGSRSSGYKTKCYTRSDGKICCTSCGKTSYGDIGCANTCD